MLRIAFAGFRHGHIMELYNLARGREGVTVVAAAEECLAGPGREQLAAAGTDQVAFTHSSYDELFKGAEFDVLATGDCYGRRGELLIRALEAGKHVIADKPICTRLSEWDRIAELSRAKGLSVGCQLGQRSSANFVALREVVRSGRIGQVQTITFLGQHPLLRATRPGWYFQPGLHGGTINDIAIHAMDTIPWLTGRRIVQVVAARTWNGGVTTPDWFGVGAQLMLRLDNGGGVLGDVSYLAPDRCGYKVNSYWRYTLHGSSGQAETSATDDGVTVYTSSGEAAERIAARVAQPGAGAAGSAGNVAAVPLGMTSARGSYFDSFLAEIAGRREGLSLTTAEVLAASRLALLAQQAADENRRDVAV